MVRSMEIEKENLKNDSFEPQQPIQQRPQQYPPPQRYPPQYGQPRQSNPASTILKNPIYIGLGIAISMFLMWLGILFGAITLSSTDAGQIKTLVELAIITFSLGLTVLTTILFFIGLGRWDYPQWVRFALIFGAVLMVIWGMTSMLNGGFLAKMTSIIYLF